MKREIAELEHELIYGNIRNAEFEYVDCLMYILGSARRAGISQDKLFKAFSEKLEINKKRNWKINNDKSYSHVK